jgi:hypothetical protein
MGQQPSSFVRVGPVLVGAEEDILADGEGVSLEPLGCGRGLAVGVDADRAEVVPEARLHEAPHARVERMAGAGG